MFTFWGIIFFMSSSMIWILNVRSDKLFYYMMDTNPPVFLKDQKEKPTMIVAEVADVEKQLWTWIHTKGLLHPDVQDLYKKVCWGYEQFILNDHELVDLQDAEYSLWKLHYKHIDEFRKRTKNFMNEEMTRSVVPQGALQRGTDNYMEGFMSFLSEATEFYHHLIIKTKKHYGLPESFSFFRNAKFASVESKKVQFLCHRFLVCLGDLARYKEQCQNSSAQNHNWSAAVACYLEATRAWADSGNPQNQLAVLATYVGDDFLALYHCIRSLAVKEPFSDAWNNLILLFERNRSSHIHSFSREASFDFLRPSERSLQSGNTQYCKMANDDKEGLKETELWPLVIRVMGFFFLTSSVEDFSCTFACMMKELDILLTLDDGKLKGACESYQLMDLARSGPFRFLQVVCIFIFVIENQICSPEAKDNQRSNEQQIVWTKLALPAAFIFMGRLVERCLKASLLDSCPVLPALLVYVEWLVGFQQKVYTYASDEKVKSSMYYFFGALIKLLNRIASDGAKVVAPGNVALWEDFELRGFAPIFRSSASLVYSTDQGHADSFESGSEWRCNRLINAAMQISDMSNFDCKWLSYDKSEETFYLEKSSGVLNEKGSEKVGLISTKREVMATHPRCHEVTEENDELILKEITRESGKNVVTEEEEVILFKPLTRYSSAPIFSSITSSHQVTPKDTEDEMVAADECLRRATSMLIAQSQAHNDPSAFHSDLTNFGRNKLSMQQDSLTRDTVAYSSLESSSSLSPGLHPFGASNSAGPPSLNAWVLNREILRDDQAQSRIPTTRHSLAPIEELISVSMSGLSINETDPGISSLPESLTRSCSSPYYSAPVPSAPLLPDNDGWLNSNGSALSDYKDIGINKTNSYYGVLQVNPYANWTASHLPYDHATGIPGFVEGYQPKRQMTSSEWLRQYRENNKWLSPDHSAVKSDNFYVQQASWTGLFDQWGAPLASNSLIYGDSPELLPVAPLIYGSDGQRRDVFLTNLQRPSPYGHGALNGPEPLLQYLKEKEWLSSRIQP